MHWFWRRRHHHHHHHHHERVWLIVNNFAVQLKPNQEIHMAQTLTDNQIDNLAIVATDGAGNPVSPTFDSPPTWTLSDPSNSNTLAASADGLTAVLTPGQVGSTPTVNLSGIIGGVTLTASLAVSIVSSAVVSISIVGVPTDKPAPTPSPAPAPVPAPGP